MSISVSLDSFRQIAEAAIREHPEGDTVIRLDKAGTGLITDSWIRLGKRSAESRAGNLAARSAFMEAFQAATDGVRLDKLPPDILRQLKVADFQLDKNGKVTSFRPLTARRVLALTDALGKLSAEEKKCFSGLQEKSKGWADDVSLAAKIAFAKELAYGKKVAREKASAPESDLGVDPHQKVKTEFSLARETALDRMHKSNEPLFKERHLLLGLAGLQELKSKPVKMEKFRSPVKRIADFTKKVAARIAPLLFEVARETSAYANSKERAEYLNKPFTMEPPDSFKRYGGHDFSAADDVPVVVQAVTFALLFENKELFDLCNSLPRREFEETLDALNDALYHMKEDQLDVFAGGDKDAIDAFSARYSELFTQVHALDMIRQMFT